MHSWIHCNMCMNITSSQLVVTSCGKVICSTCKPRLATSSCRQCQGPCTRTVPLTDKAPKEVLNLFTDISEQLKAVFKNYNFQENQKRSLLEYKERRAQQIKNMGTEFVNRKSKEVDTFGKMKEKLASLGRREVELKSSFNRITSDPGNAVMGMGQGGVDQFGQGMFGGGAGNFGQDESMFGGGGQAQGVFGAGMNHGHGVFGDQFGGGKSSTRQSLERAGGRSGGGHNRSRENLPHQPGFLEMKTPAVWYHKQKDRMIRNSPQQKLIELGAASRTAGPLGKP